MIEFIASAVSLLISLGTPVLIEYVKRHPWVPWLNVITPKANRVFAIAVVVANVFGVRFLFDQAAGTLTVTGLSVERAALSVVTLGVAFFTQERVYDWIRRIFQKG